MKAGAIFDMDGLLFDTELIYNDEWYHIATKYGLNLQQDMLNELRGTSGVLMNHIVNAYWPDVDAAKLTEELFENARNTMKQYVPVKSGVYEILTYFHKNHVRMAVASSAPLALIQNNLQLAEITKYFDVIVSGEEVKHGKPAPDIFLLALQRLHLAAEDCYVFEDGIHGAYAGIQAGCSTIMVPDLLPPTDELCKLCTGIYYSLHDVMQAIKNKEC